MNFAKFAATSPSRRAEAQDVMLQPNRGAVVETGGAPCPMDCKLEDLLAILHDRHPPVEAACRPAVSLRVLLLARQVGSCRPVLAIGTELEIARWQRNPR